MALKSRVGRIPATRPNWANEVQANFQYLTEVQTHRNGSEGRWSNRQRPRVQISFASLLREEEFQRHQADFSGTGQDQAFVLPVPWRMARLDAPSGVATLEISPMPFWVAEGVSLVIEGDSNLEAGTVSSVLGTTVTMQSNLVNSFAAGAKVSHAYLSRAQINTQLNNPVSGVREASIQYEADPTFDPHPLTSISPDQFESRDVFLTKPNWAREVSNTFQSARTTLDPGIGKLDIRSPRGFSQVVQSMSYTQTSAQLAEELLSFFSRKKGKRGSFFMPTWQVDMQALIQSNSGTSELRIDGTEFFDAYSGNLIWNTVYVSYPNGTYQVNRIASMSNDGTHTTVTMVDPWTSDVIAGKAISWCPRWRFGTDNLRMNWQTSEAANVGIGMQTLRNEAP